MLAVEPSSRTLSSPRCSLLEDITEETDIDIVSEDSCSRTRAQGEEEDWKRKLTDEEEAALRAVLAERIGLREKLGIPNPKVAFGEDAPAEVETKSQPDATQKVDDFSRARCPKLTSLKPKRRTSNSPSSGRKETLRPLQPRAVPTSRSSLERSLRSAALQSVPEDPGTRISRMPWRKRQGVKDVSKRSEQVYLA